MIQLTMDWLGLFLQPLSDYRDQLCIILVIVIIIVLIKEHIKYKEYKKGTYYQVTKLPYYSVMHDKGKYGEYLTYKYLKNFEAGGARFLFNVYIPKKNGETTEIDVMMISKKGIFVFESKNYSGWIFGSEDQKNWYQTIRTEGRGGSPQREFLQSHYAESFPYKTFKSLSWQAGSNTLNYSFFRQMYIEKSPSEKQRY